VVKNIMHTELFAVGISFAVESSSAVGSSHTLDTRILFAPKEDRRPIDLISHPCTLDGTYHSSE
jgi:hypothetical protein